MNETIFTCPLCGAHFQASRHTGCPACPQNAACIMVCCPECGYSTVNPEQSKLVGWITNLLSRDESNAEKKTS